MADGKLSPTPGPTWLMYQLEVSQADLNVEGSCFAKMQCSQQLTVWLEKRKALSFLYMAFFQVSHNPEEPLSWPGVKEYSVSLQA